MLALLTSFLAASAIATPRPSDITPAPPTDESTESPHRISLATGVGSMLNNVDEDGHGSSGGLAVGARIAYDYRVVRHLDIGAAFTYAHVDARASQVFLPSLRVRAYLGNEFFEVGLSIKAMFLASVMTGAQEYPSTDTHTNTWTGFGGGAALDFRILFGATAIELAPEIDVGTASGQPSGYYLSNDLGHASLMVWLGLVRSF